MQWIPRWLASTYAKLYMTRGTSEFSTRDAADTTRMEGRRLNLSLSRLAQHGWILRSGRGRYVSVDPMVLFSSIDVDWPRRVNNPQALQMLQVALGAIFRLYSRSLLSVAAFGSLASGEWTDTSDIDLLIVAKNLSPNYSERLKKAQEIFDVCSSVRVSQWQRGEGYHLLDLILLGAEELQKNELFLLDMTREAIILFDREDLLSKSLTGLKRRLEEKGVIRVETPSGKSYWDLRGMVE